jgi:hypothetical protein
MTIEDSPLPELTYIRLTILKALQSEIIGEVGGESVSVLA